MDQLRNFRNIALIEATSFLVLLVATVVKHSGGTELGVKILGPIHGALFILYLALALIVRSSQGWSFWKTVGILAGAVVPFGGYIVDRLVVEPELKRNH